MRRLLRRAYEWLEVRCHYEPDYTEAGDVILTPEYNARYAGERELAGGSETERRQD